MAKKQKSFADKASGSADKDAVYVKYVNSVRSKKTGHWRFNEQMVKTKKGESLDVALKRLEESANLSDIDLTKFAKVDSENNKMPYFLNLELLILILLNIVLLKNYLELILIYLVFYFYIYLYNLII